MQMGMLWRENDDYCIHSTSRISFLHEKLNESLFWKHTKADECRASCRLHYFYCQLRGYKNILKAKKSTKFRFAEHEVEKMSVKMRFTKIFTKFNFNRMFKTFLPRARCEQSRQTAFSMNFFSLSSKFLRIKSFVKCRMKMAHVWIYFKVLQALIGCRETFERHVKSKL